MSHCGPGPSQSKKRRATNGIERLALRLMGFEGYEENPSFQRGQNCQETIVNFQNDVPLSQSCSMQLDLDRLPTSQSRKTSASDSNVSIGVEIKLGMRTTAYSCLSSVSEAEGQLDVIECAASHGKGRTFDKLTDKVKSIGLSCKAQVQKFLNGSIFPTESDKFGGTLNEPSPRNLVSALPKFSNYMYMYRVEVFRRGTRFLSFSISDHAC